MLPDKFGGFFFVGTADLSDHHNRLRGVIFLESLQAVDKIGPDDLVAADPKACRLAHSGLRQGENHLIRKRSAARNDPTPRAPRSLPE